MAIIFEKTPLPGFVSPFWRQEVRMLPGGFSLVQTFPVGDVLIRGAFLSVDFDNMTAAVVKVGQVLTGGTTQAPRVSKKNNFCVGDTVMVVGDASKVGTIESIDRSNLAYDVITLTSAITDLAAGDYLQEAVLVKRTAVVIADASSSGTSVSIAKGSNIATGTYLDSNNNKVTVSAINQTAADKDVLTTGSLTAGITANTTLTEEIASLYQPAYVANAVLGADTEIRKHGLATLDAAWSAMVLKTIAAPFPESWLADNSPCLATNHNILFVNQ